MKKSPFFLILILIIFCSQESTFGYGDKKTHPSLTEVAISKSKLDDYLTNNLGIIEGIDQTYNGDTIVKLLARRKRVTS